MALVFGGIVAGEQDGPAGERGLHSVQRRYGFPGLGRGAGAELGVLLVCGDLGGSGH